MQDIISSCPHSTVRQGYCCRCAIYCEKSMGVYGLKKICLQRQNLPSPQIVDQLRHSQFSLTLTNDYPSTSAQTITCLTQISHICSQLHTNYHTRILAQYLFLHSHNHHNLDKNILLSIFIAIKFQQSYFYLRNRGKIKSRLLLPLLQAREMQEHEVIYQQMEMIQKVDYKLKLVSFVDYLQFYVNAGIMFTNQKKRSYDYDKIIHYLEYQTHRHIETGLYFSQPNQEHLALRILYQARRKCGGIDQIWNWHIECVTKTKKDVIDRIIVKEKQSNSTMIMMVLKQKKDANSWKNCDHKINHCVREREKDEENNKKMQNKVRENHQKLGKIYP